MQKAVICRLAGQAGAARTGAALYCEKLRFAKLTLRGAGVVLQACDPLELCLLSSQRGRDRGYAGSESGRLVRLKLRGCLVTALCYGGREPPVPAAQSGQASAAQTRLSVAKLGCGRAQADNNSDHSSRDQ